jgi:hypothetical protein
MPKHKNKVYYFNIKFVILDRKMWLYLQQKHDINTIQSGDE